MFDTNFKTKKNINSIQITDTTTYNQLYRNQPYHTICLEENCIMFQSKFKEIYTIGNNKGLQNGEILQLIIVASNGKFLEDIPFIELNSIKRFIENNSEIALNFINPTLYGILNHIGYYRYDKHKLATIDETNTFISKLMHLFSIKAPYDKFYELAKNTIC